MRIYLVIFAVALFFGSFSLTQELEWAKRVGGSNEEFAHDITHDGLGNTIIIGNFSGTVDFDPNASTANLVSAGGPTFGHDIFIQKLNPAGGLIWAKRVGGTGFDIGYSVAVDNSGNIYCTGSFIGTVDFDPNAGVSNLTSDASTSGTFEDIFVLKLDPNGNYVWAKRIGGTSYLDNVFSITLDHSSNVIVAGRFKSTVDFDPGIGTANLTSNGIEDGFVLKLDSAGIYQWAKSFGGTASDRVQAITVDNSGNVYMTGDFSGTVNFDFDAGTTILTSSGNSDIFVQKINSNGSFAWAKKMGGVAVDKGISIALDDANNLYTGGSFEATVDFDPNVGIANFTATPGTNSSDIFIQKLDNNGNFIWTKTEGWIGEDVANDIAFDDLNFIYITGFFVGTVDFDPNAGTSNISAVGSKDAFVQKLNSDGELVWITNMGGNNDDTGNALTVDLFNNIYTVGLFRLTADFDPVVTFNLTAVGNNDIAIQKLVPCFIHITTDVIHTCEDYTWIDGITYTAPNTTASYTMTNSSGCDSIIELYLVYIINDLTTSLNGFEISANETGANYKWLKCDDNFAEIPGEVSQSYQATNNGSYAVEITKDGCTDTSECVTISGLGLDNLEPNTLFTIYPNPTNGLVNLHFNFSGNFEINIYNSLGQIVFQRKNLNALNVEFELNQNAGIYTVEIIRNNSIQRRSLVIH